MSGTHEPWCSQKGVPTEFRLYQPPTPTSEELAARIRAGMLMDRAGPLTLRYSPTVAYLLDRPFTLEQPDPAPVDWMAVIRDMRP